MWGWWKIKSELPGREYNKLCNHNIRNGPQLSGLKSNLFDQSLHLESSFPLMDEMDVNEGVMLSPIHKP